MWRRSQSAGVSKLIVWTLVLSAAMICASAAIAQQKVSDRDISNAITNNLWIDNAVSGNNIDVKTQDGIVTLSGIADNILAKDRARELAEATVGVRAVVNRIRVQPAVNRNDNELAADIKAALLEDPATESYEVSAAVKAGVVTLTGTVQSFAERKLCAEVAKGVQGVTAVNNDINVDYRTKRTGTEIRTEIQARLTNDVRIDDNLIDVAVANGAVVLSGTVGSLQEKSRARLDAWVAGVTSVDDNGLEVHWWARDSMRRDSVVLDRTDEEIRKAVKNAFLYDPRVLSFEPMVEVSYGTVTLNGVVSNLAAKRAAEQDARNTIGVWRVKNNLKVRMDIPVDDQLKNRVNSALNRDPYVDRYAVTVTADNGWVYLSGDVNTSFEKNHAEMVAERVKGVVGVVNNIDFEYEWTWKSDRELRKDVESQLFWSPFVDSRAITVSVDNGVVTMRGTVRSWSARDDAERNAYEAGAKDVENKLVASSNYVGPYGPYNPGWPPYYHIPY